MPDCHVSPFPEAQKSEQTITTTLLSSFPSTPPAIHTLAPTCTHTHIGTHMCAHAHPLSHRCSQKLFPHPQSYSPTFNTPVSNGTKTLPTSEKKNIGSQEQATSSGLRSSSGYINSLAVAVPGTGATLQFSGHAECSPTRTHWCSPWPPPLSPSILLTEPGPSRSPGLSLNVN